MGMNIGELQAEMPKVDRNTLISWITDLSGMGLTQKQMKEELMKRYKDPASVKPKEPEPEAEEEDVDYDAEEEATTPEEEALTPEEEAALESEEAQAFEAAGSPEPVEAEVAAEPIPKEMEVNLKESIEKAMSKPEPPEDIPYQNPDLKQFKPAQASLDKFQRMRTELFRSKESAVATRARDDGFISKRIDQAQYRQVMQPYQPFLEALKMDRNLLIKFAQMSDRNNLPPYMQLRSIIVNNDIKDPNNTQVLLATVNEEMPDRTQQKYLPQPQAIDVTRAMVEQGFIESAIHNFDAIVEQMEKDRVCLVSNIYLLELYCETNQTPVFDFHIPKERLTETVKEAFAGISQLIQTLVVEQLTSMRQELKGEMVDVSQVVERNMHRFDTQIATAIERVVWKVKTDVDQTNLEDIKRAQLYILNRRANGYQMGTPAQAVVGIMLDDLERRLIQEDFKLDKITEYRRYNIHEMCKRMNQRTPMNVKNGVIQAIKAKLVVMYKDKTFSLAK